MKYGRETICSLIPHSGTMCLLDEIIDWSEDSVICLSMSHLQITNPLRSNDRLYAIHTLEYGAQAAAVHGGLLAHETGKRFLHGLLVAVRDLYLHVARLDNLQYALLIKATKLIDTDSIYVYQVVITSNNLAVAEARLTLMNTYVAI